MHVLWGGKAGFRANSDEGIRGEILIKELYSGLEAQLGRFEVVRRGGGDREVLG